MNNDNKVSDILHFLTPQMFQLSSTVQPLSAAEQWTHERGDTPTCCYTPHSANDREGTYLTLSAMAALCIGGIWEEWLLPLILTDFFIVRFCFRAHCYDSEQTRSCNKTGAAELLENGMFYILCLKTSCAPLLLRCFLLRCFLLRCSRSSCSRWNADSGEMTLCYRGKEKNSHGNQLPLPPA